MKYCSNCGTALPEGTDVCQNCGQGMNLVKPMGGAAGHVPAQGGQGLSAQGGAAWRQGVPPPLGTPMPPRSSGGSSGKTGLLIGCGILLVLGVFVLVLGGLGIYFYNASDDDKSAAPKTMQTQPSAKETPKVQDSAAWNDLVREKDEIDIAIGEVASRANQHLSRYPNFRNAAGLMNDARYAMERAQRAESRASALDVDPARRNALRALFAIEVKRAQGLYKGMVDSSNGGDYSYGFSDGTTASYAFDEANAQFNSLYK